MKPIGIKGKVIALYGVFLVISLSFWIFSFMVISHTIEDTRFFYKRGDDIQSAARMKTDFMKEVVAIYQYLLFDKEVYNDLFKTQDKKLNGHLISLEKRHDRKEERKELEQLYKIRERYNIFIDEILDIMSYYKKDKSYAVSLIEEKGIYHLQEEIYGLIDLFIREDAEEMVSLMTRIDSRKYLLRYFPYLNPLIEQIQSVYIYNSLSIRMIKADSILWDEILMLNNFWISKKDDYLRKFHDLKELFDAELTKIDFFQGYIEDYKDRLDELIVTHNRFINNLRGGDDVISGEITDTVMRDAMTTVYLLNSIIQDIDKVRSNEIRHALMIGKSIKEMSYHFLIGVLLIFGVIMAGILFVVWPIVRRVKILDETIREAGDEDLTVSVNDTSKDEIGELSRSFNKMIASLKLFKDRLEERCEERTAELEDTFDELKKTYKELNVVKSQLFQSEKMASITQLSTDMAYEITNPVFSVSSNMNVLSGYIREIKGLIDRYDKGMVLDSREIEDFKKKIGYDRIFGHIKEIIAKSKEDTEKASRTINFLKDFSDINDIETRKININNDIEYILNVLLNSQRKWSTKTIKVIKEYGRLPEIECNPLELKLLFMNLLTNASKAIKNTGEIRIKTYKNNGNVIVEFSDTGKNEKICGLRMVNGIVNKHNGKINVKNVDEKWTCFTITLPVDRGNEGERETLDI